MEYLFFNTSNDPMDQIDNIKNVFVLREKIMAAGLKVMEEIRRAGTERQFGYSLQKNISGDQVRLIDVRVNEVWKECLATMPEVASYISEEDEGVVLFHKDGEFVIACDPLDGSANIGANVTVGTIISVRRRIPELSAKDPKQFLRLGHDQAMACFFLFGPNTVFVSAVEDRVEEWTFDEEKKTFVLSQEKVTVPDVCTCLSINEGHEFRFHPADKNFIHHVKKTYEPVFRYSGTLAADIYRILVYGGVVLFPALEHDDKYMGKVRLNYEAHPMAFILEKAGGLARAHTTPILDVLSEALHQKTSLAIGSRPIIIEYTKMCEQ